MHNVSRSWNDTIQTATATETLITIIIEHHIIIKNNNKNNDNNYDDNKYNIISTTGHVATPNLDAANSLFAVKHATIPADSLVFIDVRAATLRTSQVTISNLYALDLYATYSKYSITKPLRRCSNRRISSCACTVS